MKLLINQDLICSAAYARVILRNDIGLSACKKEHRPAFCCGIYPKGHSNLAADINMNTESQIMSIKKFKGKQEK